MSATAPPDAPPKRRKYKRGDDRERQILDEAVRYFAECGFDGQTRELAKRIGISHGAIYRHFDSKEALIERVYEHVYASRWRPEWEGLIRDRSRPLCERMVLFYHDYAECVIDYQWVRIFISSGMKGYGLPGRYLGVIREKVIRTAAAELRAERGLPDDPPTEAEEELFWGLHGSIFYLGIRKFIYEVPVPDHIEPVIEATVRNFFRGLRAEPPAEAAAPRLRQL